MKQIPSRLEEHTHLLQNNFLCSVAKVSDKPFKYWPWDSIWFNFDDETNVLKVCKQQNVQTKKQSDINQNFKIFTPK